MSDLVERVARAIYEEDDPWHKAWPWPGLQSDQAGVDQYRRIAQAAIAAMQTDAAPALKPAVEVWEDAYRAWDDAPTNPNRIGDADRAAAAVIEADRAAIIAAKDAEIAALKNTWQKQFDEKVKERNEAKLWFEKAQEWKQSFTALQAHADALAGAVTLAANRLARCALEPEYGTEQSYEWREWSDEARQALSTYEEFRR